MSLKNSATIDKYIAILCSIKLIKNKDSSELELQEIPDSNLLL